MKRFLTLGAVALIVGCGGSDSPTGPITPNAVGTFNLTSVNGQGLPVTFSLNGQSVTVQNDTYNVNSDHTWSEHGSITVAQGGTSVTQAITDSGTWSQNGTAITFTSATTGNTPGSLAGNAITITGNGFVGVYTRQ